MNHPWTVLFLLLAIPAALTGLRVPSDFGCHISDGARARADVLAIGMAVEEYAMNNRRKYPATLDDLIRPDAQGYRYLNQTRLPRDPWGREYVYVPGNPPNVLTHGRDGVGKWDGGGRGS